MVQFTNCESFNCVLNYLYIYIYILDSILLYKIGLVGLALFIFACVFVNIVAKYVFIDGWRIYKFY